MRGGRQEVLGRSEPPGTAERTQGSQETLLLSFCGGGPPASLQLYGWLPGVPSVPGGPALVPFSCLPWASPLAPGTVDQAAAGELSAAPNLERQGM